MFFPPLSFLRETVKCNFLTSISHLIHTTGAIYPLSAFWASLLFTELNLSRDEHLPISLFLEKQFLLVVSDRLYRLQEV